VRLLAPRLIDAHVDRSMRGKDGASDHAPGWIMLRRTAK
jgi:exodeoxyribonuclease-3